MTNYERITFRPEGGRARSVILKNTRESDLILSGVEVSIDGDEVAGKGFDERVRIISKDLILKRVPLVMDKIYGELVETDR